MMPERAVRCGLLIRDGLAEAEADAGDDRLHVRVGVTTGEALVSLAERVASMRSETW